MSNLDFLRDFVRALDTRLPPLPQHPGEWHAHIGSPWVDGVSSPVHDQDPNMTVHLYRSANNEEHYDRPVLEHEICVQWSAHRGAVGPIGNELSMPPESAILLGRYLTEAGSAAVRDRARNADFLTGVHVERSVAPLEPITDEDVRWGGRLAPLAMVAAGDVTVEVERFDSVEADRTVEPAEWLAHTEWPGTGVESCRLDLKGDSPQELTNLLAALSAAASGAAGVLDVRAVG